MRVSAGDSNVSPAPPANGFFSRGISEAKTSHQQSFVVTRSCSNISKLSLNSEENGRTQVRTPGTQLSCTGRAGSWRTDTGISSARTLRSRCLHKLDRISRMQFNVINQVRRRDLLLPSRQCSPIRRIDWHQRSGLGTCLRVKESERERNVGWKRGIWLPGIWLETTHLAHKQVKSKTTWWDRR